MAFRSSVLVSEPATKGFSTRLCFESSAKSFKSLVKPTTSCPKNTPTAIM